MNNSSMQQIEDSQVDLRGSKKVTQPVPDFKAADKDSEDYSEDEDEEYEEDFSKTIEE